MGNMINFFPNYIYIYKLISNDISVGDFNPSEKYARQIGSFPQIGEK